MRQLKSASTVALIGLVLAACSETPVGPVEESGITEIVVTPGAAAAPRMPRPSKAVIAGVATINGASVGELTLSLSTCESGTSAALNVTFSVSGNQNGDGSFKVNRDWIYGASGWVGENPVTISIPNRTGNPTSHHDVALSISNTHWATSGTSTLEVSSFDITNTNGGHPNALNGEGTASIEVTFVDCVVPNTAPWLHVPKDFTAEATGPGGAAVSFRVRAYDREDGRLTDAVVCKEGDDVVQSGDTFALGEHVIDCSVEDSEGLETTKSFKITVVDTTPPDFLIDGQPLNDGHQVTVYATSPAGWALSLSELKITADDLVDGDLTDEIVCIPAEGSIIGLGVGEGFNTEVGCSVEDAAGNEATVSFFVNVTISPASLAGFIPPLRNAPGPYSSHKAGSAIPHKFLPVDIGGEPLLGIENDLRLVLTYVGNAAGQVDDMVQSDPSAGSTAWKFEDGHYHFNVKTPKGMTTGDWETEVSYRGVVLAATQFNIKK
jgi:hypothetical protein